MGLFSCEIRLRNMRFSAHASYDFPNKVSIGQLSQALDGSGRRSAAPLHVRAKWAEPEICPANGQSGFYPPKSSANQGARLALLQILAVFIFVLEIESVAIKHNIYIYGSVSFGCIVDLRILWYFNRINKYLLHLIEQTWIMKSGVKKSTRAVNATIRLW